VSDVGIIAATQPKGAGGTSLGSGEAGLVMDTRTGTFPHTSGFSFQVTARHTPDIFSNPSSFTKLRGFLSASVGGHVLTDVQLNARVGGEKNWGSYPFFESAFVGGASSQAMTLDITGASTGNTLRGYDLNRFAGDASVVANTELQVALGKFNFALPFRWVWMRWPTSDACSSPARARPSGTRGMAGASGWGSSPRAWTSSSPRR